MAKRTVTVTTAPARPFKVVYDLDVNGPVRVIRSFATEERARQYAALCTPDGDGKIRPNVRDEGWRALEGQGFEYSSGVYWHDNRSAVIMRWDVRPEWTR